MCFTVLRDAARVHRVLFAVLLALVVVLYGGMTLIVCFTVLGGTARAHGVLLRVQLALVRGLTWWCV